MDKLGTAYTDKIICTGYGAHIATPMLRDALDRNPSLSQADARQLVEKAMEVLFYRDARSFPKYLIGTIDKDEGIQVQGPIEIKTNWEIANYK